MFYGFNLIVFIIARYLMVSCIAISVLMYIFFSGKRLTLARTTGSCKSIFLGYLAWISPLDKSGLTKRNILVVRIPYSSSIHLNSIIIYFNAETRKETNQKFVRLSKTRKQMTIKNNKVNEIIKATNKGKQNC